MISDCKKNLHACKSPTVSMAEGELKSELLLISICFLLLSWFLHPETCACKSIMLSVGYKMWNQIEFDSLSL